MNRIYLFTYECASKQEWTNNCIDERLAKLYDIKNVHDTAFLVKTTEDIDVLEKYLMACFDRKDTYFLVDVTSSRSKYLNCKDGELSGWLENI
ncbi:MULTISPECIES: hypothetical protein [Bacillus]|uniref:hypothetical protein n=1 Tax=Bacillus TaxID=1386 RepID=UPI0011433A2D|nr:MULTISPECIES: hypothetical protein [Bacillus]